MFSRICSKLVLLIKAFWNHQFLFWQVTSCQIMQKYQANPCFPTIKYSCFILELYQTLYWGFISNMIRFPVRGTNNSSVHEDLVSIRNVKYCSWFDQRLWSSKIKVQMHRVQGQHWPINNIPTLYMAIYMGLIWFTLMVWMGYFLWHRIEQFIIILIGFKE